MTIKLTKDEGVKILSKESGLIEGLLADGWVELKEPKKKPTKTEEDK